MKINIPTDLKPGEVVTIKYDKDGNITSSVREQTNWKPSPADLDVATIICTCGNSCTMPFDALMFLYDTYCGQCGQKGTFTVCE